MNRRCKTKELEGRTYRCYFELTLSVIGGKWKPVILFHLAQGTVMRFGDLTRSIPDITQRMLTKQLRELENDGVLTRKIYQQVPPKVEYRLTPLGYKLIPLFLQMREWGIEFEKHLGGEHMFTEEGYEPRESPIALVEALAMAGKMENQPTISTTKEP